LVSRRILWISPIVIIALIVWFVDLIRVTEVLPFQIVLPSLLFIIFSISNFGTMFTRSFGVFRGTGLRLGRIDLARIASWTNYC
jgi:hypothetical protein